MIYSNDQLITACSTPRCHNACDRQTDAHEGGNRQFAHLLYQNGELTLGLAFPALSSFSSIYKPYIISDTGPKS